MKKIAIVWFRQDLRLTDNPALHHACTQGYQIIPLYIWAPDEEGQWPPGTASRWWLHHSLHSLSTQLKTKKSMLIIRQGDTIKTLQNLIDQSNAQAIFWNRRFEPCAREQENKIEAHFEKLKVKTYSFNGSLLFLPDEIANKQKKPFKVFTAYYKTCLALSREFVTLPEPSSIPFPKEDFQTKSIDDLKLIQKNNYPWTPGTQGAQIKLKKFLENAISKYETDRNYPSLEGGTSKLSAHLHYGEISPRIVYNEVEAIKKKFTGSKLESLQTFQKELIWREFAHHILFHFPESTNMSFQTQFQTFPWKDDNEKLQEWQQGKTGYPIVDAGMRELNETGWMHNRVRMIVGSLLVKNLQINWLQGAKYFWDKLVDADLANNSLAWQWVAGTGTDHAPYFRIFNPTLQSQNYDREGTYIKKWVPELKHLTGERIHEPTCAKDYPKQIVNFGFSRKEALAKFKAMNAKYKEQKTEENEENE